MIEVPCRDDVAGGVGRLVAPGARRLGLGRAAGGVGAPGRRAWGGAHWYVSPPATAKSFVPKWEAVT